MESAATLAFLIYSGSVVSDGLSDAGGSRWQCCLQPRYKTVCVCVCVPEYCMLAIAFVKMGFIVVVSGGNNFNCFGLLSKIVIQTLLLCNTGNHL